MNQSEAFLFLTNCEFFLLEVAEKTLTKNSDSICIFNFQSKNGNIRVRQIQHCGRCHETGHSKRTCREPI